MSNKLKNVRRHCSPKFLAAHRASGHAGKIYKLKPYPHRFFVALRILKDWVLQINLLILVHSSYIPFVFRFTSMLIIFLLCSPEYTSCMDFELSDSASSSDQEEITEHSHAFSKAKLELEMCESNIRSLSKDLIRGLKNKSNIQERIGVILSNAEAAEKEIECVKTHDYIQLSDLTQRFNTLKQTAVSQQKQVSEHNLILDPTNSPLWKQLKMCNMTSLFTLATAATGIALTLVVTFVRSSKNG
jgi:hypothetical protein